MLTRLYFKNWRSLREVEITNLTPITIFIGANSSGKSNTMDALHFLRTVENAGGQEAIFLWGIKEKKVRTLGVGIKSPIEIDFDFALDHQQDWLTENLRITQKC